MNAAGTVVAILASSVIVLSGLVALTRAVVGVAIDLRDNKVATVKNTSALAELSARLDTRITGIEARLSKLEGGP